MRDLYSIEELSRTFLELGFEKERMGIPNRRIEEHLGRRVVDPRINQAVLRLDENLRANGDYSLGNIQLLDGFGLEGGKSVSVSVGSGIPDSMLQKRYGVRKLHFGLPIEVSRTPMKDPSKSSGDQEFVWACLPRLRRETRSKYSDQLGESVMDPDLLNEVLSSKGQIKRWANSNWEINAGREFYEGETRFLGKYYPVKFE